MSHSPPPASGSPAGSTIATALDKNEKATEEVKKAADELAVVHAVLDIKLAGGMSDGDVASAIAKTGKVEQRLTHSAETLDEVNETLKRESGPAR